MSKTYTAKNGATYIKLPNGKVKFTSGASPEYMAKIRNKRKSKKY